MAASAGGHDGLAMIPDAKLERVLDRFHAIEAQLASGHNSDFAKLSKEHAQLAPVVNAIQAYKDTRIQLADSEAILKDPTSDPELKTLAEEEANSLRKCFGSLESHVKLLLLPKDAADSSNATWARPSLSLPTTLCIRQKPGSQRKTMRQR